MEAVFGMALATIILTSMAAMAASAASPTTFVFGDSLTDVGNNNFLQYSLAKSNYPWYGVDYEGGQATGRFTNGRTVGDIISAKLGISSPPPYLSLSMNDDALLKGVNYASGGAGILNDTGLYFIERLSLDDQVQSFNKTREVIKAKIGSEAATKLLTEALYFIGIGSNDYVNNFLQPFLPDGQEYTHDDFVGLLIGTLGQQFQTLYQLDARKMIFHGLGPLGCIPSQRVKSKKGQCLKEVNLWVLDFNSKVEKLIASLNRRLPRADLTFADTYSDVLDLISNPTAYGIMLISTMPRGTDYCFNSNNELISARIAPTPPSITGFKVSNTSCCKVDTRIGGLCLPNSKLCKNRKDYVFWDAFHPSDAANAVLADKLFSRLFPKASSPAPTPSH